MWTAMCSRRKIYKQIKVSVSRSNLLGGTSAEAGVRKRYKGGFLCYSKVLESHH